MRSRRTRDGVHDCGAIGVHLTEIGWTKCVAICSLLPVAIHPLARPSIYTPLMLDDAMNSKTAPRPGSLPPPLPPAAKPPPLPPASPPKPGSDGYHVNEELIPENELEQVLSDAKAGKIALGDAMNFFLRSEASLLDTEFDPDKPHTMHLPFMQYGPRGEALLALFSSVKRAAPHRLRHPQYRYFKTAAIADVIRGLGPGIGLVLNSGWKVGLQLPPSELDRIRTFIN
jgi:hypothetical protein